MPDEPSSVRTSPGPNDTNEVGIEPVPALGESNSARAFAFADPPNLDFASLFSGFADSLKRLANGFLQGLATIMFQAKKAELIELAGWLPHYTTPFEEIEAEASPEDVKMLLERHYQDNWLAVRAQIEEKLDGYDLDAEAKESFREAMDAHEKGYYRAVVRMLFPEIERVASKEVYGGKQYEAKETPPDSYLFWISPDELAAPARQITSMTGLRGALSKLPIGNIANFEFGLTLYDRVQKHLYKNVGSKPQQIRKYESDPVPNRHASLHGLVSYKTFQNSINILIMTDFMFHCISGMKKYIRDQQEP
ncbi:hypothetical protein BV97_05666 [Novosphingobium resinovorum]|uniref:Uncharacterized protein n=1 Tax=Novosphingobium resinovorum TaxID=158500 RepID=A0A031J5M1_9SPHN|nr:MULTISPECIES: hypothetical protein [Novosphingobium]EZP68025.1 hypothetical protein BV97_05666 [Novosphingobium resinovorum]